MKSNEKSRIYRYFRGKTPGKEKRRGMVLPVPVFLLFSLHADKIRIQASTFTPVVNYKRGGILREIKKYILTILMGWFLSVIGGGKSAPNAVEGFTTEDYAQHLKVLKKKLPAGFSIVIQEPFVVIGDESPGVVRYRAEHTVKWAVKKLKSMYFKKDLNAIIDIWLFKDRSSYLKHTWEIFQDKPDTPFGYSSSKHNALIMNIATGGGTLVHEIVHPFVAANFPGCPAWFNEGLGSLYEQSTERGDEIIGLTNWRLAGLQDSIKKNRVPSFKALTSTTDDGFYNEDPGTNYAQARYLCYYLQEKGLLVTFYHKFHANRNKDPTGFETLKQVLSEPDMDAFKKKWERFVLKLRFP